MTKHISSFRIVGIAPVAAIAVLVAITPQAQAAAFGSVVPIGGHAADIALDEARGVLYVANFGTARIDAVSLAKQSVASSLPVAPYRGSISLSPDGRFLLAAQFGNFKAPNSSSNALTVIDLTSHGEQTLAMGDPPLGVAFGADGRALVVTTTQFLLFDPASGSFQMLDTSADAFVASRQDFPLLSGAYSASNYDSYIVDNHLLDPSLVPLASPWTMQVGPPRDSCLSTRRVIAPSPRTRSRPGSCSVSTPARLQL